MKSMEELQEEKMSLLAELAKIGDMRRGTITEVFRRCGKDNCACHDDGHPGHGPFYAHTVKVNGKTKTIQLRPGAALSKLEREVFEYKNFRTTTDRILDVSEKICDIRPTAEITAQEKKRRFLKNFKKRSLKKSKR